MAQVLPPFSDAGVRGRRCFTRVAAILFLGLCLVIGLWNRFKRPRAALARPAQETAAPDVAPTPGLLRVGPDKDSVLLEPWPGGRMLALAIYSGQGLIFNPHRPDSIRRLQLGADASIAAALPDGGLVYGTGRGLVRVAATPGEPGSDLGHLPEGPVALLGVSPDHKLVVASGGQGYVGVWELASRGQVGRFKLKFPAVLVNFLDASTLIVATNEGELARYSLDGRPRGGYNLPNVADAGSFEDAVLSPDRRRLVLVSGAVFNAPPVMWVVDLVRGVEEDFPDELEPGAAAFSPDSQVLAVCSDGKASIYNFATRQLHSRPLRGVPFLSVGVLPGKDPDHPLLLIGRTDGKLQIVPF